MDDTAIELVTAVELKRRASEFAIIPPYPAGYVQVPCPTPWELSHVALAMVALVAGLRSVRTLLRTTAPPLGRRAGCWLHGPAWCDGAHAASVDWQRFADVCFFSLMHAVSTAFVGLRLRDELSTWLGDAREAWWAFTQPALTDALRAYYVLGFATNMESALSMAVGVVAGRGRDVPMMVHHAAVLFVMCVAYRLGFARVGVAILALHDATDLPIDCLRIAQALHWESLQYVAAALALLSWSTLRGWCFPRYIIASALFDTHHLWETWVWIWEDAHKVTVGYALFLVPLVLLWGLSCFWLRLLCLKVANAIGGRAAQQAARPFVDLAGAVLVAALGAHVGSRAR